MSKNRSDLALAKFMEADAYAPNWGRLDPKWGEALFFAGKKAQARAQWTGAPKMALSDAENAELSQAYNEYRTSK